MDISIGDCTSRVDKARYNDMEEWNPQNIGHTKNGQVARVGYCFYLHCEKESKDDRGVEVELA